MLLCQLQYFKKQKRLIDLSSSLNYDFGYKLWDLFLERLSHAFHWFLLVQLPFPIFLQPKHAKQQVCMHMLVDRKHCFGVSYFPQSRIQSLMYIVHFRVNKGNHPSSRIIEWVRRDLSLVQIPLPQPGYFHQTGLLRAPVQPGLEHFWWATCCSASPPSQSRISSRSSTALW